MDTGGDPLERNVCLLYIHYCESSKSLEGDRERDRVRHATISSRSTPEKKVFKEKNFLQIL